MIPAVPEYVNKALGDSKSVPPGHRFSLYFPIWNASTWQLEDKRKSEALRKTLDLPRESKELISKLRDRQRLMLANNPEDTRLSLEAIVTAPLVTGMGMEHPLENGFAFLNPYGLPYLPGSSIKGVVRAAAQDLSETEEKGWSEAGINLRLFGSEDSENSRGGALTFWDAIPEIAGGSLTMDVMTPHYGDYYQGKSTPHDAGQPNPIVFMVIPPQSEFSFHVTADLRLLAGIGDWKTLLLTAFEYAFEWLGFGAKTAVGYGAMRRMSADEQKEARAHAEAVDLRCPWVDSMIDEIAKKDNVPEYKRGDILRGKRLAEAWKKLDDKELKKRALADIRGRWQQAGWWDEPSGKKAKQARAIYDELEA